ncbi:MAG: ZIP family metal transporter [Oscillospiraceae bacterium]|nr:ZIP family metal transporter [Oscillospiraceae bacterium]
MHETVTAAFLTAVFAGLSAVVGAFSIFIKADTRKTVTISLGFAAGLTMCVSILELFPHSLLHMKENYSEFTAILLTAAAMAAGAACGFLIDKIMPNHSCAHTEEENENHHDHNHDHAHEHKNCGEGALFHTGLATMASLALHNLPEGAALFVAANENLSVGITMAAAVALHSIPEGAAVAMPVYLSTGSKLKAFAFTAAAGLTMPLGALAAWFVLAPFAGSALPALANAFVGGIMMYISLYELIPASRSCGMPKLALWSTIAGICLMPITHMFHHHH